MLPRAPRRPFTRRSRHAAADAVYRATRLSMRRDMPHHDVEAIANTQRHFDIAEPRRRRRRKPHGAIRRRCDEAQIRACNMRYEACAFAPPPMRRATLALR